MLHSRRLEHINIECGNRQYIYKFVVINILIIANIYIFQLLGICILSSNMTDTYEAETCRG